MKNVLAAGLGMAVLTKETVTELVNEWVSKGHVSKEEGERLLNDWLAKVEQQRQEFKQRVEQEVHKVLENSALVTRKQYVELETRLNALEQRLSALEKQSEQQKEV